MLNLEQPSPDPAALLARHRPLADRPFVPVVRYGSARDALALRWGWAPSPFGPVLLFWSGDGLCGLAFDHPTAAAAEANMRGRWPAVSLREDAAGAARLAARAFSDEPPPLHLLGSPFQHAVWNLLLRVEAGAMVTYGALALALQRPSAARAVGAAVGRNPVSWLVPCHRAMLGDGRIHAYEWGVERKRRMLLAEAAVLNRPVAAP